MALEDLRLWLEVENHDGNLSDPPATETIEAFEYRWDREIRQVGYWEVETLTSDASKVRDIFESGAIEPQNARFYLFEGPDESTSERTLSSGVIETTTEDTGVTTWELGDWSYLLQEAKPFDDVPSGTITDDISDQSILSHGGTNPQSDPLDWDMPHKSPIRYLKKATVQGGFEYRIRPDPPSSAYTLYDAGDMGGQWDVTLAPERGNVRGEPQVEREEHAYTHLAVFGGDDPNNSNLRLSKLDSLSTASADDDREIWLRHSDAALDTQDDVDDRWDRMADDVEGAEQRIDIELTAVSIDPQPRLGDGYYVHLPEQGVTEDDGRYRVIAVTHHLDSGEERFDIVLSNRVLVRPNQLRDERERLHSIDEAIGGI